MKALAALLATLRAMSWHYQTAHWQVKGANFYGDHLMFQRLYEGMEAEIDTLAEKLVGYNRGSIVDPGEQAQMLLNLHHQWHPLSSCLFERSALIEERYHEAIQNVKKALKAEAKLTPGIEDFLDASYSLHEEHLYLLRQRLR